MKEIIADNIRELLGHLIGKTLVEITQADPEDIAKGLDQFIELMFDSGHTVKFFLAPDAAYHGRTPLSFYMPDEDDQFEDGYFHPTEEEKAAHGWIAVEWRDAATGSEMHVVPTWGKDHYLDETCWCAPVRKTRDDGSWFWGHNEDTEAA